MRCSVRRGSRICRVFSDTIAIIVIQNGETEYFREKGNDVWLRQQGFPDWIYLKTDEIAETLNHVGVEVLTLKANPNFRNHDRLYDLKPIGAKHTPLVRSRTRRNYELIIYLKNLGIDSTDLPETPEEENKLVERVNVVIKQALIALANEDLLLISRKFPFWAFDIATFSFEVLSLLVIVGLLANMISEMTLGTPSFPHLEKTTLKEVVTDYFEYVAFVWAVSTLFQIRERTMHYQEGANLSHKLSLPRIFPNFPLDRYMTALRGIVGNDFAVDLDTAMPDFTDDTEDV